MSKRRGRSSKEHGIEFRGGVLDSGVCHQAFFADPDGNLLALHHRYAPKDVAPPALVDDPEQLGVGLAEVAPAGDELLSATSTSPWRTAGV